MNIFFTAPDNRPRPPRRPTATPIKHVVVIFGENVSFDHYFATYPKAANTVGETQQGTGLPAAAFEASPKTPAKIATLARDGLLAPNNPNSSQPQRLTAAQAVTCDQDHGYTAEQKAYNGGLMNKFVEFTSRDACAANQYGAPGLTMDYYDGNTVTGIWNYAQNYAMSDTHFSTVFGPSTPGALNLVSGQTHGVREFSATGAPVTPASSDYTVRAPDANGVGTVINDPDPVYDDCSNSSHAKTEQPGRHAGQEHRRPAQRQGRQLGLVPGRLHPDHAGLLGRNNAGLLSRRARERRGGVGRRLLPAPPAVPVLRLHCQPAPPGTGVGRGNRAQRPGQPPVRPDRVRPRSSTPTTCPPCPS